MTDVAYEPRGAAAELFTDTTSSEIVMAGPAGTGKSLAALMRIHIICLMTPNYRALVIRKTAVSLASTTLVTFKKKVIAEAERAGVVSWYGGSAEEPPAYRYKNGARVVVGGMDKPEKIMSSEYDMIFVDEATELTEQDWEYANTRLRNYTLPWQQLVGACNPGSPTHWMLARKQRGTLRMLASRHIDNPAYMNRDGTPTPIGEDYFKKLQSLTGHRKARLWQGQWAAAEGVIYDNWDEVKHLWIPPTEDWMPPKAWRRYWVIDFGFNHPFVCQWWAEDPDGVLYMYREIYYSRRLVEDHCKTILDAVSTVNPDWSDKRAFEYEGRIWTEPKPKMIICDHDAEGRATLQRHLGMSTRAANKKVLLGIEAVKSRLEKRMIRIIPGRTIEIDPILVEAKKPTCTIDEMSQYIWATKRDHAGATVEREEPLKENDDGCDCIRYMVSERDLRGRPGVRFLP